MLGSMRLSAAASYNSRVRKTDLTAFNTFIMGWCLRHRNQRHEPDHVGMHGLKGQAMVMVSSLDVHLWDRLGLDMNDVSLRLSLNSNKLGPHSCDRL
jgi:hypothetical protein